MQEWVIKLYVSWAFFSKDCPRSNDIAIKCNCDTSPFMNGPLEEEVAGCDNIDLLVEDIQAAQCEGIRLPGSYWPLVNLLTRLENV